MSKEDSRVKGVICGVKRTGPSGIEWVCVKKPHGEVYTRRTSDRTHHRGDPIYSDNPGVDKHYFVNRYPNHDKER